MALTVFIMGAIVAALGIAVRHGHVILVLIAFGITTLPLPIIMRPADAATPTFTPPGGPGETGVFHYHLDHLGSEQVTTSVTRPTGASAVQLPLHGIPTARGE
ncbi:MAG TPA: hypothetical protein VMW17_22470 [Candidatus Binatia bacterium]|nr:hypothetical protein [Candidatus Binatia bacterium]